MNYNLWTIFTGSIGVFGLFFTAEELLTNKMKLHYDNAKTNIQFKDRILSRNGLSIFSLIFICIFIFKKINSKISLDNGIEEFVE